MNCKEIKYFLLGSENPDQPPAEIKAHLAVCKSCQDWENRLAVIELNLPFLPVPASAARAQLLDAMALLRGLTAELRPEPHLAPVTPLGRVAGRKG